MKTIIDNALTENQNIGLIFPSDIAKGVFDIYFFRIARRFPLHRTYDSEIGFIPAGTNVPFGVLGEKGIGVGESILEIRKERPFRILHFAFGIRPSEVWLYRGIPSDVPQTGFGYVTSTRVGDKWDYISGAISPYDSPTVATETIIYHKLSMQVGLRNDSSRPIRPSIRILGMGYDCIQITDEMVINKMLAGIIPCRFITVGGLAHFNYVVPKDWGEEVKVSSEIINKILGDK